MRVRRSADSSWLLLALGAILVTPRGVAAQDAPRILIDQPVRAVEYQLGRLTNDELTLVERKDDDVRYRPVYVALLTRKGVAAQFRDEALAALEKIDKASRSRVLLDALTKVPLDDQVTAEKLLRFAPRPTRRDPAQGASDVQRRDRRGHAPARPSRRLRCPHSRRRQAGPWHGKPPRSTTATSPRSCSARATFQTRTCELSSSPRFRPCSAQRQMPPRKRRHSRPSGGSDLTQPPSISWRVKSSRTPRPRTRGSHRVPAAHS